MKRGNEMAMRCLPYLLLAAVTLLTSPLPAADVPASVNVTPIDGARLFTVTVPGRLLDVEQACYGDRCHGLLLLAAPAGEPAAPRTLWRFDPAAPAAPEPLLTDLPPRADALAVADVDGDGGADLLLGEPGRLYRLAAIGETLALGPARVLVESRHLDLESLAAGGFLEPGRVIVPAIGALNTFVPGGTLTPSPSPKGRGEQEPGGELRLAARVALPVRAARESTGLRLSTFPVTRLALAGRTLYAVGPEAHGHRRLRTVLVDPAAGEEALAEAWSWLPAPESVVGSRYAALNGRPALIVTTVRADHLGVFEKKKLRVFSLRTGDRSRSGLGPSLKADTASHHWQDAEANVVDADGDGLVDLVLVQPEGLGGKKLVVEAYLGRRNAQFHSLPLRSVVPAKHPDAWRFGADVDGDGVGDLVTRSDRLLQVFAGVADPKKKQVLARKPRWQIELAAAAEQTAGERDELRARGRPEARDLDRDDRAEVLVRAVGEEVSVLWVVDPG